MISRQKSGKDSVLFCRPDSYSGETRMRIGLPIFFLKQSKASLILSKEVFSLTAAEKSSRPSEIKLTIRFKSAKILDYLDLI